MNLRAFLHPHFAADAGDYAAAYIFLLDQQWNVPHWWRRDDDCSGLLLVERDFFIAIRLFSDYYSAKDYTELLRSYLNGWEDFDSSFQVFNKADALTYLQSRIDDVISKEYDVDKATDKG